MKFSPEHLLAADQADEQHGIDAAEQAQRDYAALARRAAADELDERGHERLRQAGKELRLTAKAIVDDVRAVRVVNELVQQLADAEHDLREFPADLDEQGRRLTEAMVITAARFAKAIRAHDQRISERKVAGEYVSHVRGQLSEARQRARRAMEGAA